MQRQLILPAPVFGNHCFGGNACLRAIGIDLVKDRQHPVQAVDRIHIRFGPCPPIERIARRAHGAIWRKIGVEKVELQLERASGAQAHIGE
jgi:hypothetical protein